MPKVYLSSLLQKKACVETPLIVDSGAFSSLITELSSQYPTLREYIFNPDGTYSDVARFTLNNHFVFSAQYDDLLVQDTDVIHMITAYSGG